MPSTCRIHKDVLRRLQIVILTKMTNRRVDRFTDLARIDAFLANAANPCDTFVTFSSGYLHWFFNENANASLALCRKLVWHVPNWHVIVKCACVRFINMHLSSIHWWVSESIDAGDVPSKMTTTKTAEIRWKKEKYQCNYANTMTH